MKTNNRSIEQNRNKRQRVISANDYNIVDNPQRTPTAFIINGIANYRNSITVN